MNDQAPDAITPTRTPAMNRRTSLAALGAAAFAARNRTAKAGKAGKKARKKCEKQRGPCERFIREGCGASQECLAARLPCCRSLEKCKFLAFGTCFEAFEPGMS